MVLLRSTSYIQNTPNAYEIQDSVNRNTVEMAGGDIDTGKK